MATGALPYRAADLLDDLHQESAPAFAHSLGALPPLPAALSEALALGRAGAWFQEQAREALPLAPRLLDFGSEVSSRKGVWRFQDEALNTYFAALFETIVEGSKRHGLKFELSTEDLFHGHVFAAEGELGILFHAKEYPSDLFPDRRPLASFNSKSREFPYRNFLWLASTNQVWMLRTDAKSPLFNQLIFPSWLDPTGGELEDVAMQFRQAKTLQEAYFSELGEGLGSVNYFSREVWSVLDPKAPARDGLLFFTL